MKKKCRVHIGYDENGYPETCDKPAVHEVFQVPYCKEHYDKKIWGGNEK